MGAAISDSTAAETPIVNDPNCAVLVVDLRQDTTTSHLYQVFGRFGECHVQFGSDETTAVVEFASAETAAKALEVVHLASIRGRTARCFPLHLLETLENTKENRVIVTDLDETVEPTGLANVFDLFGEVLDCKVEEGEEDDKSLGRGFAHYRTYDQALMAIENLDGMKVGDRNLKVKLYDSDDDLFPGDPLSVGFSYFNSV